MKRLYYFLLDKEYFGFKKHFLDSAVSNLYLYHKMRWLFLFIAIGASAEDYFLYEFYKKNFFEINTFVTLRRRRIVTELLNRKGHREWVEDKKVFENKFQDLLHRAVWDIDNGNYKDFERFVRSCKKVIAKPVNGYEGCGIYVLRGQDDLRKVYEKLRNGYVVEEYLEQEGILHELNPGTCNTIRVNVLHLEGQDIIPAAYLRMGRDDNGVDNFRHGGIAALVDAETGIISTYGRDMKGHKYLVHPCSGKPFVGLQIPNWGGVIGTVHEAAKRLESVPFSSWDIAVVGEEVAVIEGNTYGNMGGQQCLDQIGKWEIYKNFRGFWHDGGYLIRVC